MVRRSSGARTLAAVAASVAAFVSLDAAIAYLIWGGALGMSDTAWMPSFPLWVLAGSIATAVAVRLRRAHRKALVMTAIVCALLSAGFLWVATGVGLLACGESGGCSGPLARAMISHSR